MSSNDDVFRALADSTRRSILEALTNNSEQTLFELCTRLIMEHDVEMSRQGVSSHLDVLEDAGLIESTRRGKYKVMEFAGEDQIKEVMGWLDALATEDGETDAERN